ncbi:DNA helicase IV [Bacillus sp. SLBN-46]|nr:DNA helicase IV [Bacillus sp. SLBN-46]
MILAPNRLFIDYISAVLPELGVNKINQTTYIDFMRSCLGQKIKLFSPNSKLMKLLENNGANKSIQWVSSYKGSLEFKELINRFIKDLENKLAPEKDFVVENSVLMKGQKLKKLFLKEYTYLPIYKRLGKIKNLLEDDVKKKKSIMLSNLHKKYEEALDKALYNTKMKPEKRKQIVVSLMERKEERKKRVEQEAKVAVKRYMDAFVMKDIFTLYKELMSSPETIKKHSTTLTNQECKLLSKYCQRIFTRGAYELEDLAPLFFMKVKLEGIDEKYKMRSIFIDEAQDYSYFQFAALKEGFETDLFTIVGDLAQGIHSYRGLNSWTPLLKEIFPNANYQALQKSYRTTVEIMNLANDILKLIDQDLPKVVPVIRHGDKPRYIRIDPTNLEHVRLQLEQDISTLKKEELHSIAIIGRTERDCQRIHQLFEDSYLPIQLLEEKEEMKKGHIVILPSYLSKGLEFDAVLLVCLEEPYSEVDLDIKLLYVSMTRPMHRLYLFGKEPADFLLNSADTLHFES